MTPAERRHFMERAKKWRQLSPAERHQLRQRLKPR
jgi:hypothetical protein